MLYLTHDIWHLYYMAYSWLSLLQRLGMIIILLSDIWYLNSCTPEPLYSWTPISPVLMSPALLLLLIAQSFRRPVEYAWCRDDEDVSHNRASVRRILNGTKCHTEQSAHHTRGGGYLLNLWGPPLESIPHTEQSVTQSKVPHHTRGGHLLNLWGYLLYQPSE